MNTSIESELGAIFHMAGILSSKRWCSKKIVIYTDSMETIDLIKIGSYLCLQLSKGGKSLRELINSNVVLSYVPRSFNTDVDSLAKMGLSRPNLKSYWVDGWADHF